jgi:hypothetical protein
VEEVVVQELLLVDQPRSILVLEVAGGAGATTSISGTPTLCRWWRWWIPLPIQVEQEDQVVVELVVIDQMVH